MRLGGPIFEKCESPDDWARAVRAYGYRAAFCPVPLDADDTTAKAFAEAAAKEDVMIAEVGAWSNPLSPDDSIRRAALQKCQNALDLADRIGAKCAVNITGSRGPKWDGPFAEDLTPATFDLIVESIRKIVDEVKPTRSVYTLETMPWMYPDSADSYLALLKAIDRPKYVAVHLDPVNLINCPERYFNTKAVLEDCFEKLGSMIVSCHGKDTLIQQKLTLHIDEVRPGQGVLDYRTYLRLMDGLPRDVPLMLEHLKQKDEFALAADHVKSVAAEIGVKL